MDRDGAHIPFALTGAYPIRGGNAVRPLVDGEAAFRRICEAVEAAEHSVWVTVAFIEPGFEMPDGRGSLFDVLDRAAERSRTRRAGRSSGATVSSRQFQPGTATSRAPSRELQPGCAERGSQFHWCAGTRRTVATASTRRAGWSTPRAP